MSSIDKIEDMIKICKEHQQKATKARDEQTYHKHAYKLITFEYILSALEKWDVLDDAEKELIRDAINEKFEELEKAGCDYCNKEKQLLTKEIYDLVNNALDELQVIVDRGYLRLGYTNDMQCIDHGEKTKINFCPHCGRKLDHPF